MSLTPRPIANRTSLGEDASINSRNICTQASTAERRVPRTPAPNDERALVFCGMCKLLGAAAFADSGLTAKHEDLTAPAKHLVERAFEEAELFCAPDEGRVDAAGGAHGILRHG